MRKKEKETEQVYLLAKNVKSELKRLGKSKKSLADGAGLSRLTIHKILNGEISRMRNSTVEKIANFFGTECYIILNEDLEEKRHRSRLISTDGNKNPICVPILNEIELIENRNEYIGEMVVVYPVTYHFSDESNIVAVRVESSLSKYYSRGNILIINRESEKKNFENKKIVFDRKMKLITMKPGDLVSEELEVLGTIIEERVSVR